MLVGLATCVETEWLKCADNCSESDALLMKQLNLKHNERLSKRRLDHEVMFHSDEVVDQIVQTIQVMHPNVSSADAQKYAVWFVAKGKRSNDLQLLNESKGFEMNFEKLEEST